MDLKEKWQILGETRSKKGDFAGAAEAYEKVVAIDPKCLKVWNELGTIYFNLKKTEQAIKAFRQVLVLSPSNVSALLNLGSALVAGKQVEEGLVYLDQAASLGDTQARDLATSIRLKFKGTSSVPVRQSMSTPITNMPAVGVIQSAPVRTKYQCMLCGKEFGNFTSHSRARHPELYQLQLRFEIEVLKRRQEELEALDPSIKQIPPGMVKEGGVGVSSGNLDLPAEKDVIELDFFECNSARMWERLQFPQTALEYLPQAPVNLFNGQDVNYHQLELLYQTSLEIFKQEGAHPTPRREALAFLRDYCDKLKEQWLDRLDAHSKEQIKIVTTGITCSNCGGSFKSKSGLSNHKRMYHPADYEKQIEKQERSNPYTFSKEWTEYLIARRKFEFFLFHDRIDEAIEQLRIEISKYLKNHDRVSSKPIIMDLDTGQEFPLPESEENRRLSYQRIIDQAWALFKKHYKNREIPQEIQDLLNSL